MAGLMNLLLSLAVVVSSGYMGLVTWKQFNGGLPPSLTAVSELVERSGTPCTHEQRDERKKAREMVPAAGLLVRVQCPGPAAVCLAPALHVGGDATRGRHGLRLHRPQEEGDAAAQPGGADADARGMDAGVGPQPRRRILLHLPEQGSEADRRQA